nr:MULTISPECIES: helix-turn-helix domain-containing protein [unclassified Bradyrhizobium]
MRQIRQMLRLARDGVSAREIGRTLGVARSTIQDNLKRAAAAGLAWPLAGDLTDAFLNNVCSPMPASSVGTAGAPSQIGARSPANLSGLASI